jgi:hypothetical protein
MKTLPQPWSAALEATMFSGWIYDHLKPHAAALKVAHPLRSWLEVVAHGFSLFTDMRAGLFSRRMRVKAEA